MIVPLVVLCERAAGLVGTLPEGERADGGRLLALCEDYSQGRQDRTGAENGSSSESWVKELSRLVEYLSRRNARGIPLATLGRATLSHHSGDAAAYAASCREADAKLELFGV